MSPTYKDRTYRKDTCTNGRCTPNKTLRKCDLKWIYNLGTLYIIYNSPLPNFVQAMFFSRLCFPKTSKHTQFIHEGLGSLVKAGCLKYYPPWKLTCPMKRDHFERTYIYIIFQPSNFRGYSLVFRWVYRQIWRDQCAVLLSSRRVINSNSQWLLAVTFSTSSSTSDQNAAINESVADMVKMLLEPIVSWLVNLPPLTYSPRNKGLIRPH